MLSRALNLLKRKRNAEEPAKAPEYPEVRENLFSRAFRKIKRRFFRPSELREKAICLMSPSCSSSSSTTRYEVTPAPAEKPKAEQLLPREYVWNDTVNLRESRNFEFKTGGGAYPIQILPEHIRKYGSAFLNCEGGVLIAGILDNGRVRGIYCDRRLEERIHATLEKEISNFYPKVDSSLYSVHFVPVVDRRDRQYIRCTKVVEIVFKAGDPLALYETGDHKVFLRREGSVEGPLSPLQIKDVVLRKYRKVLEERREMDMTLLSP